MEGNLSQGGGLVQGGACFGGFDLQGSVRAPHHPHTMHQQHQGSSVHEGFPLTMGERSSRNSASEEDEPSFTEDGGDGPHESGRGKKGSSPWQRVKWTDKMVRLLITAVSYIGEDGASTCDGGGARRKLAVLQKKGKWKSVSKVMAERGYHVSPQQCEDKFNDLNKRYKKLNDMLGRGTSCQVVEDHGLLDLIDYLSEKEKDDVRKILSSKHLFYEEMCSYHNGNRLHLPHDPALQRSLQLALRNIRSDDHDNDDDQDDRDDDFEENYASLGDSRSGIKKMKQDATAFGNALKCQHYNKSSYPHGQIVQSDAPESMATAWLQKQQWVESCSLQLEEQKLQIQVDKLELEKQRLKWQRFSKKKDRELEKLSLENERIKLENERIALELKRKEIVGTAFN